MSLSLISEAYFVDSDSETGGGEDHDEEGDENEHEIKFEPKVPEVGEAKLYPECNLEELNSKRELASCNGVNEDDKKLETRDSSHSLSPNISGSDDDGSGNNGSSEATEVVKERANKEAETNRQFPNVPVGMIASSSSSDELFTRVISRRKKKKRFGDWMWSYRKRQQGCHKWKPTREKLKRNSRFHEMDVDSVVELISASESGTGYPLPSPLSLSSSKQKLEVFKCPYCLETVLERNELIKHLETHQDNSNGKILIPRPQASNAPSHTANHSRRPSSQKTDQSANKSTRYTCKKCGTSFSRSYHLARHENRVHHMKKDGSSRTLLCKICGRAYSTRHFSAHMRIHEEQDRAWSCSECPSFFTTESHLRLHSNVVHGRRRKRDGRNRKRTCHICNASCCSPSDLKIHMSRIHTDEPNKPWKCQQCPSFFLRFSSLSCHENRVHGKKISPTSCPLCKQQFTHRPQVFRHLRNLHGLKQSSALLKVVQASNLEPNNPHIPPFQHVLSQMRPCNLELTRCDHLISQFTRSTPAVSHGTENGRGPRNKVKSQIGENVTKLALTNKSADDSTEYITNDIEPSQDLPEIVRDINQSNFRRAGLKVKAAGITEGNNSPQAKRMYTCPYCFEAFGEPTLLIGHLPLHTKLKKEQNGEETPPEPQSTVNIEGNGHGVISSIKNLHKEAPSSGKASSKSVMSARRYQYQCSHCSYSCTAAQFLDNHMKLHSEEGRPFKCRQCSSNFKTFMSLRTHEGRFHKEAKDLHQVAPVHKCERCRYSNKSLHRLMRHMECHKEEGRHFKCHRCLYTFKSFQRLRLHESRSHKGLKSSAAASTPLRKCTECNYFTRIKQEFKNHVAGHRKENADSATA